MELVIYFAPSLFGEYYPSAPRYELPTRGEMNSAARRSFRASWRVGLRRPRRGAAEPIERPRPPRRARACSTASRHMVTP